MGTHLIAEFLGVDSQKISRVRHVREVLERVIAESGLKAISSSYHQFKPPASPASIFFTNPT